jgi:hypothetical protein
VPQVALGSVTPLALANASASSVILLLDQQLKSQEAIYVHPLLNTHSLGLTPAAFDAAIRWGRALHSLCMLAEACCCVGAGVLQHTCGGHSTAHVWGAQHSTRVGGTAQHTCGGHSTAHVWGAQHSKHFFILR